jgi:hypothetical protein
MASAEPPPTRPTVDSDSTVASHTEGGPQPAQLSPARSVEPEKSKSNGDRFATFIGSVAGGAAFLLVALFLGSVIGALAALVAAFVAWRSRRTGALIAFIAAALLSLLALWLPLTVQLFGAVAFGAGLLLSVRARPVA